MTILIHPDQVPLHVDEHGDTYVGSSRVLLDTIVGYFKQGMVPDEIARNFDTVSRADVYAVLAYYLRHQVEIDEYLQQREQEAAEQRRRIEATQGVFLAEMKARRQEWDAKRSAALADPID